MGNGIPFFLLYGLNGSSYDDSKMQPTEGKARIGGFVEDSMISHR
jgi:hypothetical protein